MKCLAFASRWLVTALAVAKVSIGRANERGAGPVLTGSTSDEFNNPQLPYPRGKLANGRPVPALCGELGHPNMELVAVQVCSPKMEGKDAGELCEVPLAIYGVFITQRHLLSSKIAHIFRATPPADGNAASAALSSTFFAGGVAAMTIYPGKCHGELHPGTYSNSHQASATSVRVSRCVALARMTFAAAALALSATAGAQAPAAPALVRIPAPVQPAGAISLPVPFGLSQAASPEEQWLEFRGRPVLINVSRPTLTPVLPEPGKATGAAMIVAPGGGFLLLAMDKEGWNVARWLADHGIAAFVLKYRVRPFFEGVSERRKAGAVPDPAMALGYPPAIEDAKAALRLVHSRAASWGIDPDRIGMIGFSAGARLTLNMAIAPGVGIRPDFVAAIYPPMDSLEVPASAPPLFTAIAADDTTTPIGELGLVRSWHGARRPVEFHLYEKGGHGFGVPGAPETTTTLMMDQLKMWLSARHLIGPEN